MKVTKKRIALDGGFYATAVTRWIKANGLDGYIKIISKKAWVSGEGLEKIVNGEVVFELDGKRKKVLFSKGI